MRERTINKLDTNIIKMYGVAQEFMFKSANNGVTLA